MCHSRGISCYPSVLLYFDAFVGSNLHKFRWLHEVSSLAESVDLSLHPLLWLSAVIRFARLVRLDGSEMSHLLSLPYVRADDAVTFGSAATLPPSSVLCKSLNQSDNRFKQSIPSQKHQDRLSRGSAVLEAALTSSWSRSRAGWERLPRLWCRVSQLAAILGM